MDDKFEYYYGNYEWVPRISPVEKFPHSLWTFEAKDEENYKIIMKIMSMSTKHVVLDPNAASLYIYIVLDDILEKQELSNLKEKVNILDPPLVLVVGYICKKSGKIIIDFNRLAGDGFLVNLLYWNLHIKINNHLETPRLISELEDERKIAYNKMMMWINPKLVSSPM